ncbi:dehydrogenase [Paenibacillus sp. VTT E-133280]|uniref:Gfo/Idh/MocA family protein n=1 Tax=Paenibacillus sp. VTT E-133280 TaxID=1986222 RepID=UPI000BA16106|nr:Gfo/Idh/MocA family oxidoreductase [Paenibacillus sp. VTT E-133280]OZQ69118.1 dehydrogenase [Paenibacillus sp. VTT E-133280]
MNIGVLGTGFGAYHAQLWTAMDRVDKVIIFGRNEAKLQKLKQALGVEITTHIDDIMLDSTIDVIDICLPSNLHRQYAVDALMHGKHVFCETPICFNLEDALAMKEAEQLYDSRILVNQFIKFDPAFKYLYETTHNEKYGKLLSLTLKRETPPLWGDLGLHAIATKLMIHELDFVTWMLGSIEPNFVWGTDGGKSDQAIVRAVFQQSNRYAEIIVSSQMPATYPFSVGYEAYFEQGKLVYQESDNMNGAVESSLIEYTAAGKLDLLLEPANPYQKSLEYALQCLIEGSSSIIELDNAIQAIELAICIEKNLV